MASTSPSRTHDVIVVGGGLIGLACATAIAEKGCTVRIVSEPHVGEASLAAAGMLAPSIERGVGPASEFAVAARDRYPAFLDWLADRSGFSVPLNREGIIQVALSEAGVRGLQRSMPDDAEWLDAAALAALEPALAHGLGGVFHAHDGAIDNVLVHTALREAVARDERITVTADTATRVDVVESARVFGRDRAYEAAQLVLAAGAWSTRIAGLPRPLPIEPVRGQMIAYDGGPLRHVVYGPTGYVVPRPDGRTLIGATMERAGFESVTTPEGVDRLRRTAAEVLPDLADVEPSEAWAGLRPISADLQPILGPDPGEPRLIYATGHSRNGVLMTPLTGECIAAIVAGEPTPIDLTCFSIARFENPTTGA